MLRIRLQRRGKPKHATYRVVVADQHAPIKGRFISDLGFYNPHTDEFKVQQEPLQQWIKKGAKPSSTVHNLLVTHGLLQAPKVTSWRPKKKEPEQGLGAAAAPDQTAPVPAAEQQKKS